MGHKIERPKAIKLLWLKAREFGFLLRNIPEHEQTNQK